jgi:hypothetical protein
MRKILNILLILGVLAVPGVFAVGDFGDSLLIESVTNLGMGGPGTAVKGRNAVLYNPALMAMRSGLKIGLVELPFSMSNDVIKFYKFYNDNQDDLEDFDTLSIARQTELLNEISDKVTDYRVRFKLGVANPNFSIGPFPFPFLGKGGKLWWGVGFYNQADIGVKMNAGILVPTVDVWAHGDGILAIPVAYKINALPFKLPGELYTGVNIKYVIRAAVKEERMSILEFESYEFSDEMEEGYGMGFDLGALYGFNEKMKFSFVMRDVGATNISYDSKPSDVIKTAVDMGASYQLNKMIMLAADLRDIKFDDIGKATLFTKLYMGGEANLLSLLKVRGGFYQGYPSIGFGFLGFLNYAFYGRELGMYPGENPEYNHVVSLSIGF